MTTGQGSEQLFFALIPDPDTGRRVHRRAEASARKYGFNATVVPADRLHISLHHVGCFETHVPPGLVGALDRIVSQIHFSPFEVTFDRALSFRGRTRHPFVLTGGAGLDSLRLFHQKLGDALHRVAGLRVDRKFTPHLTLCYDNKAVPEHAIQPVRWKVDEFILIHSFIGHGRYSFPGRWPMITDVPPSDC